nr:transglutaminase domain-containing protein [uncultured Blautia sp.]
MKKKNFKTLAACLCLSCTLLTGTLPTQAAARTSVSQTAKSSFTVTNKKTHSGKGQASSSSSDTWKTIKGRHYYYNARGKKVKGKVKIGSRYYFFDKNGIQRYGWKKIKNNYYFFRISTGTTGAYMLTSTTINGIALDASGRASKSGSNLRKLKLMTEANKIVEKISRPGMNKMQRLRASFDYVKKQYTYYCWREFRNTQDWEKDFAEDMFFRGGRGDCVSYAAAFAYLANAVGMKKVYVICSGGHGWAEIGGKVYDPDWALVSSVDSYFAMSYDLSGVNGRPMYRGNRLYVKKV